MGELPTTSFSHNTDGLLLPLDDDLSMSIYQALQRLVGVSNKIPKPVNEKKLTKENKRINKQQWNVSTKPESNNNNSKKKTNGPSLQDIMNEEINYMNTHKTIQVRKYFEQSTEKIALVCFSMICK